MKKLFVLVLSILMLNSACDKKENTNNNDLSAYRQELATQLVNQFILPAYADLDIKANSLKISINTFKTTPTALNLEDLRTELKSTWLVWQKASIIQFGATETNGLRVSLNIYPTSTTKIEDNISTGIYTLGSIDNKDAEGFPAVDYLINGTDALSLLSNSTTRMNYLEALILRIESQISLVNDEWQNGQFTQNFKSETANGTDVGSALGLITNSMDKHFQSYLRDGKVAIPSGVRSANTPRPLTTEAYYGAYSRDLLVEAIESYEDLFSNGSDVNASLYGYLAELDRQDIAEDIATKLATSKSMANQLDNNLSQQIQIDNQKMIDLFIQLQDVVTVLKSDMASAFGVSITNQDNDGD